jgi:hypothetical protein
MSYVRLARREVINCVFGRYDMIYQPVSQPEPEPARDRSPGWRRRAVQQLLRDPFDWRADPNVETVGVVIFIASGCLILVAAFWWAAHS